MAIMPNFKPIPYLHKPRSEPPSGLHFGRVFEPCWHYVGPCCAPRAHRKTHLVNLDIKACIGHANLAQLGPNLEQLESNLAQLDST